MALSELRVCRRLVFEKQKKVCYKDLNDIGEVAEWFKAAVLKTAEVNPSVSSNLTFSANNSRGLAVSVSPLFLSCAHFVHPLVFINACICLKCPIDGALRGLPVAGLRYIYGVHI